MDFVSAFCSYDSLTEKLFLNMNNMKNRVKKTSLILQE